MFTKLFLLSLAYGAGGFIAQTPAPAGGFDAMEAGKFGFMGVVLLYILYRLEPRMRGIETALAQLVRAIGLMLIEIKQTSPGVRAQAEALMKEMDAADAKNQ